MIIIKQRKTTLGNSYCYRINVGCVMEVLVNASVKRKAAGDAVALIAQHLRRQWQSRTPPRNLGRWLWMNCNELKRALHTKVGIGSVTATGRWPVWVARSERAVDATKRKAHVISSLARSDMPLVWPGKSPLTLDAARIASANRAWEEARRHMKMNEPRGFEAWPGLTGSRCVEVEKRGWGRICMHAG